MFGKLHDLARGTGLALVLAATGFAVHAEGEMAATMAPDTLEWGEGPPGLPQGAELAVLSGNPAEEGTFVIRLRLPEDFKVAPHTHMTAENVTVISGAMRLGHGTTVEEASMTPLTAGAFAIIPAGHEHYAMADEETVIQIHGDGPFSITYVNPADDPRGQTN